MSNYSKIDIEYIRDYFKDKFNQKFNVDEFGRLVIYRSESYYFEVEAAFIQNTGEPTFTVSIQERLDKVFKNIKIEIDKRYVLSFIDSDEPAKRKYQIILDND